MKPVLPLKKPGEISQVAAQVPVFGGSISAWSIGEGPAVIFLHGGPGDTHHYMKRMAEPLCGEFKCIFFDQRGVGASSEFPRHPDLFSLEHMVNDLVAVVRFFGIDRPMLVGHSWGAMYALLAGLRHPDFFKSLALLNMGPLDEEMGKKTSEHLVSVLTADERVRWRSLREQRNAARDMKDVERVVELDRALMELRVKAWVFAPELRAGYLEEFFRDPPTDREVNNWVWSGLEGRFEWDDLEGFKASTWLCVGAQDSVPVRQASRVMSYIPHGQLTIFERCGHIPWLEYPEIFYQQLRHFLAR